MATVTKAFEVSCIEARPEVQGHSPVLTAILKVVLLIAKAGGLIDKRIDWEAYDEKKKARNDAPTSLGEFGMQYLLFRRSVNTERVSLLGRLARFTEEEVGVIKAHGLSVGAVLKLYQDLASMGVERIPELCEVPEKDIHKALVGELLRRNCLWSFCGTQRYRSYEQIGTERKALIDKDSSLYGTPELVLGCAQSFAYEKHGVRRQMTVIKCPLPITLNLIREYYPEAVTEEWSAEEGWYHVETDKFLRRRKVLINGIELRDDAAHAPADEKASAALAAKLAIALQTGASRFYKAHDDNRRILDNPHVRGVLGRYSSWVKYANALGLSDAQTLESQLLAALKGASSLSQIENPEALLPPVLDAERIAEGVLSGAFDSIDEDDNYPFIGAEVARHIEIIKSEVNLGHAKREVEVAKDVQAFLVKKNGLVQGPSAGIRFGAKFEGRRLFHGFPLVRPGDVLIVKEQGAFKVLHAPQTQAISAEQTKANGQLKLHHPNS